MSNLILDKNIILTWIIFWLLILMKWSLLILLIILFIIIIFIFSPLFHFRSIYLLTLFFNNFLFLFCLCHFNCVLFFFISDLNWLNIICNLILVYILWRPTLLLILTHIILFLMFFILYLIFVLMKLNIIVLARSLKALAVYIKFLIWLVFLRVIFIKVIEISTALILIVILVLAIRLILNVAVIVIIWVLLAVWIIIVIILSNKIWLLRMMSKKCGHKVDLLRNLNTYDLVCLCSHEWWGIHCELCLILLILIA